MNLNAVEASRQLWLLPLIAFVLSSCSSQPAPDAAPKSPPKNSGLPADPVPRKEPRSRYGNPPVYEVFGIKYYVSDTSYGYKERGVASWYGTKFHGRATSSQEPYVMHKMTAAHKSLPLPTYARVKNLKNGRTIVVRINDRGPFVDNRIIDLSYSAAIKLDMVRDGTALVEVTALSYDDPPISAESAPSERAAAPRPPSTPAAEASTAATSNGEELTGNDIFVQVGAFGDVSNAKRRFSLLKDSGIDKAFVHKDETREPALYRIRIGPLAGVDEYDSLVSRLSSMGIAETHLVTN